MSISVIIPAKNAARHIGDAIASVLAQNCGLKQILVVDDGSSDDTRSIIAGCGDPRVRLLANARSGVSAARNTGAAAAEGEWLMFLDADDRLRPAAFRSLLRATAMAPRAVVVYGDYDRIDANGKPAGRRRLLRGRAKPSGNVLKRMTAGNFIVNGGATLVRASAFAAAGGFDEGLAYCEDWHCWCRLAALGDFHFVPEILLDYRMHPASAMSAAVRSPEDFLPAVERVFGDRLVLDKLPPRSVVALRRAAEVDLIAYAAAQAIRFHRYRQAIAYAAQAIRRSPLAAPRVAMRLGLARFGI